jgi:hypothetical protein
MLAEMGNPLTTGEIIELANEIIDDTKHCDRLTGFKFENIVGTTWYKGFMGRHLEFLKRSKAKIRDQNRIDCCTYKSLVTCTMIFITPW